MIRRLLSCLCSRLNRSLSQPFLIQEALVWRALFWSNVEFFRAAQRQHSPLSRESTSCVYKAPRFAGLALGAGVLPLLPSQPVTRGRRLCGEGAHSSTKSVPVQIARPWQAAGAGFAMGRHMQGTPRLPRGVKPPAATVHIMACPGEGRCHENELLPCDLPRPGGSLHCGGQELSPFFPFLFSIPFILVFTAERQQRETVMVLGCHGRTDPAQLALLRS